MIRKITSMCVFTLFALIQLPANGQGQPFMCPDETSCEGLSQKDINEREIMKTREKIDISGVIAAPLNTGVNQTVNLPVGGEVAKQVSNLPFIDSISKHWADRMKPMREKLESIVEKECKDQ